MDTNTRLIVKPGIIQTELDTDIVLMHLDQGVYFSLNEVGACIWKELASGASVEQLCEVVSRQFEVDRETVQRDIISILESLKEEDLVEICNR